jgi:hypothetical protein
LWSSRSSIGHLLFEHFIQCFAAIAVTVVCRELIRFRFIGSLGRRIHLRLQLLESVLLERKRNIPGRKHRLFFSGGVNVFSFELVVRNKKQGLLFIIAVEHCYLLCTFLKKGYL